MAAVAAALCRAIRRGCDRFAYSLYVIDRTKELLREEIATERSDHHGRAR